MKRRDFLGLAMTASGGCWPARLGARGTEPDPNVKTVLVMFKCHFDLGFIDTQAGVIRKYFETYFPQAIQTAQAMRDPRGDQYIWTTGSWLLYEYLEQAAAEPRLQMEQAVQKGDIAWHALPYSWQSELLDGSMIAGSIGLSRSLDHRFGRTTTGAKMTDVPGHTRGLIRPLAENGVTFLDIGVNSASTPPDVPSLFIWKDSKGNSLAMMYHHTDYGGVVRVPGSDLAVAIEVRDDNSGPHTVAEIRKIYAGLRQQFPNAGVRASNLTDIANAIAPFRTALPVVTQEIGDTWIYGVPSDPVKVARYREVVRLRSSWIASGEFKAGDATDIALLRRFGLAAEHTWGTDTKTWLDFDHYTPHDLALMLDQPKYKTVQKSWVEKRDDIDQGIAALPPKLRAQALHQMIELKPVRPSPAGLQPCRPGALIETTHYSLALDPKAGAIQTLRTKPSGRDWASPDHPLALFAYQTLSKQDYDHFLATYVKSQEDWAPKDFGKPNIEHFGAQSRTWLPTLVNSWAGGDAHGYRVLAELRIDDEAAERGGLVAWPKQMFLEIVLPNSEPALHVSFSWFGKQSNRLPEALWLTWQPAAPEIRNWKLDKVGENISPYDVVRGGNRHMHALASGLDYQDAQGRFNIETLDAPVVALGARTPLYPSDAQPDISKGIHFSLYNNAWGTNYIQWFGEDIRFRFRVRTDLRY
jgi:hypothetical protein